MSAGMLPSALGVGEGGAFRAPMAIAVIGGIIVSTVLSLVVVPSFYLIMDDLSRLLAKFFQMFIGAKEVEPESPEAAELAQRINRVGTENAALRDRLSQIESKLGPRAKPSTQHAAE
jgi:type II secretory pathway component PulF